MRSLVASHGNEPRYVAAYVATLLQRKEVREAEALYREILKANDGDVIAINNLFMLLAVQEKRLDEAQQLAERAISLAGPAADLLDTRACVLIARGKPHEAIAVLEQAISP